MTDSLYLHRQAPERDVTAALVAARELDGACVTLVVVPAAALSEALARVDSARLKLRDALSRVTAAPHQARALDEGRAAE